MSLAESLAAKLKKIEEDFSKAGDKVKNLVERRAQIDRELAVLREDQLRMQGAHQELKALVDAESSEKKTDVKPKIN